MKIAMLSPVAWRTPPRHYGPWEQVASNITEGLVAQGFDVTLFATKDSITNGRLDAVIDVGYEEDRTQDAKVSECLHISNLMEKAYQFDIIHNSFDFLPFTYSSLIKKPVVTTIHGFSSPKIIPVYKKYNNSNNYYVAISNANRHASLQYAATIYNGIDYSNLVFNKNPKDYLLFFGRIHPDKGAHDAIEIARRSKKKLIICGIIQDHEYFKNQVEPYVNEDDIIYAGIAGPEARNELLGNALALLHPIHFEEPFGLSVAEAMFCGTPVIAYNKGSMPELIINGKTGFLVHTIDEAVEAVESINNINRDYCRTHAAQHFSMQKMVSDYIELYQSILKNR